MSPRVDWPKALFWFVAIPIAMLLVWGSIAWFALAAHPPEPITAHGGRTPCATVTACRRVVVWQRHERLHLEHRLAIRYRRDASYALRLASAMSGLPLPNLRCIGWAESRMGAQTSAEPSSGAKGLMQFLPSTWSHTPFAAYGFSVWDNVANALAAVQIMVHDGSARQWVTGRGCGL